MRHLFPAHVLTDKGFDLLNRYVSLLISSRTQQVGNKITYKPRNRKIYAISLLTYDPKQRITAAEALRHPWFTESPLPVQPCMMPTFPSRAEG